MLGKVTCTLCQTGFEEKRKNLTLGHYDNIMVINLISINLMTIKLMALQVRRRNCT